MSILTSISGAGGGGGTMPNAPLYHDSVNTIYTVAAGESALAKVRSGADQCKVDGIVVMPVSLVSAYQPPIAPVALVSGDMFIANVPTTSIKKVWYQNTTSVTVRVIFRFGLDGGTSFGSNGFEHHGFASCLNGEATGVITNNQSSFFYSGASTETGGPLGAKSGILQNSGQYNGGINSATHGTNYLDIAGNDDLSTSPNPAPFGCTLTFDILAGHDIRSMFQNYTSNGANNVLGQAEFEVLGSDAAGTTIGGDGDYEEFILPTGSTIQGGQQIIAEYTN